MRVVPSWVPEMFSGNQIDGAIDELLMSNPTDATSALYRRSLLTAYGEVTGRDPDSIEDPLVRFMVWLSDEGSAPAASGGDQAWATLFATLRTEDPEEFARQCNLLVKKLPGAHFAPFTAWLYRNPHGSILDEPVQRFPTLHADLLRLLDSIRAANLSASSSSSKPTSTSSAAETKGGGCYIATAVYGSYDAPEVMVLRRFRDEKLAASVGGRMVIRSYYRISPTLARILGRSDKPRRIARRVLDHVVEALSSRR